MRTGRGAVSQRRSTDGGEMKSATLREQTRYDNPRRASHAPGQEERTWPEDIDYLIEQTYHPDPRVRKQAVHGLCPCNVKANNERVWDRLIEMVADEDAKVRGWVLHTLADGSPRSREQEIVQAIERMQHDPDPSLRRRVRKLLAHYRAGGKINIL
ncbi:MAG: HEAT repeat domain-containing protein [Chloroflexota bacterium]|nr:HEAT repeat domain-containing protein [Chloroflexota bacterium]